MACKPDKGYEVPLTKSTHLAPTPTLDEFYIIDFAEAVVAADKPLAAKSWMEELFPKYSHRPTTEDQLLADLKPLMAALSARTEQQAYEALLAVARPAVPDYVSMVALAELNKLVERSPYWPQMIGPFRRQLVKRVQDPAMPDRARLWADRLLTWADQWELRGSAEDRELLQARIEGLSQLARATEDPYLKSCAESGIRDLRQLLVEGTVLPVTVPAGSQP